MKPNQYTKIGAAPAKKSAAPAKKTVAKSEKKEELSVVSGDLANSEMLDDILGDAGAGSESMGRDDLAIPRITILQALSPQVKKREATYVDGAEEGMIFDTVGHTLWDGETGILAIPCSYRSTHIEWAPRESGGGFVADLGPDASCTHGCTKNDKGQLVNSAGNLIVRTAEYYIFLIDEDTGIASPYVLSMASTQLKHSRRWNTLINTLRVPNPKGGTFNPAMFYRAYRLTTAPESSDRGSWFGWEIKGECDVISLPDGNNLYLQARNFRESVMTGAVKASVDTHHSPSGESDDAPM